MSYIKITQPSSEFLSIRESEFTLEEGDILLDNSAEYFCTKGHSFALAYAENLTPAIAVECPEHEIYVFNIPANDNPLLREGRSEGEFDKVLREVLESMNTFAANKTDKNATV